MIKCKYAGDKSDEYCKDCNGCTMMVNGVEENCDKCAGYEADTHIEPPEATETIKPINVTDDTIKEEKPVETVTESSENTITIPNEVIVKSIRYMSGCTVRKNDDLYYKFTAEEEWELPQNVTFDEADNIRQKLWDKVNDEIDKQVEDVLK